MMYEFTATLEKDGWELAVPAKIYKNRYVQSKPTPEQVNNVKKGDVVGLIFVVESERNDEGQIVAVTHHQVWIEVQEVANDFMIGILKTGTEHPVNINGQRAVLRGEKVSFKREHVYLIR